MDVAGAAFVAVAVVPTDLGSMTIDLARGGDRHWARTSAHRSSSLVSSPTVFHQPPVSVHPGYVTTLFDGIAGRTGSTPQLFDDGAGSPPSA